MATLYLPKIAEADHDTLRNFIKHYPADSYDKWLYLQSKQIANWKSGGTDTRLSLSNFARTTSFGISGRLAHALT